MIELLWVAQQFIYWCLENKYAVQCMMLGVTGLVTFKYIGSIVFVKKRDAKLHEVIGIATFVQLCVSFYRTLS